METLKVPVGMIAILFISMLITGFTMNSMELSRNKKTVNDYMDGFRTGDHAKILSCLTDDVVWEMPGVYYHSGKIEFDKEIENEAFTGLPIIEVARLVEESGVVVAEGSVKGKRKDGGDLHAVFCDVFLMERGKIKKLTSYLMIQH